MNLSTKSPDELFDERFFEHYYELMFSFKLLSYIRKNYILTYESQFKNIEMMLRNISKNMDNYINNIYFQKEEIDRYLTSAEITGEILKKLRTCLGIDTLSLAIDRFDWSNGSSAYTQQILNKYFDLFDKVIITTDDLTLGDKKIRGLEDKGYLFITPTYGKNTYIIKQIIKRRIQLYNYIVANPRRFFDENVMTDEIYKMLADKSEGDISVVLNAFGEITDLFDWKDGHVEDLEHQFDIEIDRQLRKVKELRMMDANPAKLHL